MKTLLTFLSVIVMSLGLYAQTDGITYQAVIINPEALELPGVDSEGNYLPNQTIAVQFTIFDSTNQVEFQEVQITDTDAFGRINLLIGDGDHDYFKEIEWDGTPKDLKVAIDFDAGNNFETMSREHLTFLPYAYHRNITATGTLTVDDRTFLNGELVVEGPTNLNSTLDVNNQNATNLSGSLTVEGETNINADLNVNNNSNTLLTGDLAVNGNAIIDTDLDVLGATTLNDLTVNGEANFGDLSAETLVVSDSTVLRRYTLIDGAGQQVRITSDMPESVNPLSEQTDTTYPLKETHPLLIDGHFNGLAIEVNSSRNNNTNFITFYDTTTEEPWGRIEGETDSEFGNNADWLFDQTSLDFDIYDSGIDFNFAVANSIIAGLQLIKSLNDYRGCFGIGGCVAAPGPADIIFSSAETISAAAQAVFADEVRDRADDHKERYDDNKVTLQGVTYASGAGDYAEYLMRKDINEKMTYGDVVGLSGGKISKNTGDAERIMVISYKPIVLGNMPDKNRVHEYEKVAFMGQVPVKVYGKVNVGDYIIPSGMNNGIAVAISPKRITTQNIDKMIGVAWTENSSLTGLNLINVAVGLNHNDALPIIKNLETTVATQNQKIAELEAKMNRILELLENDATNTSDHLAHESEPEQQIQNLYDRKYTVESVPRGEIIYWEISDEDLEKGFQLARTEMLASGIYKENEELWERTFNNEAFKINLFKTIKERLKNQFHYHKEFEKGNH